MTLFEIATTIPGMLTIALIGPFFALLGAQLLKDAVTWTADTIESFRYQPSESKPQPVPVAQNDHEPMSIRDTEALAYISNHAAMRFHRKS